MPALGGHGIWPTSGASIGATPYTTSAVPTAATGSTFVLFVVTSASGNPSVTADPYNTPSNWHRLTSLTSGTNPVQAVPPGGAQFWVFVLANGNGGASHTLTVAGGTNLHLISLIEITGAGVLDQSVSTVLASAAITISTPITPTSAGQFLVAGGFSPAQYALNPASGSGFTKLDGVLLTNGMALTTAYYANVAQATYDPVFTTTATTSKCAFALSFRSAISPPAPPTGPQGAFTIRTT